MSDHEEISRIAEFKTGYTPLIEKLAGTARAGTQVLASPAASNEERTALRSQGAGPEKCFTEIQKLTRELISELNPGNLEKSAQRDYHNVFSGDVAEHRLSFVQFLRTHILLRRLEKAVRAEFDQLLDMLRQAGISENAELRRQLQAMAIRPAQQILDALRVYCDRMALVLRLQQDALTIKSLAGVGIYAPEIPYQLSTIFRENLADWLNTIFQGGTQRLDPAQLGAAELPVREVRSGPRVVAREVPKATDDWRLDASGTTTWNRTPNYYFQYDPRLLEAEREKFQDVVYMDTHMGADQQYIKSDFILNVSRRSRAADRVEIEREYVRFLHSFFNLVIDISLLNVNLPPKLRDIFVYHLGPHSFFNLTVKFLQEVKTGSLHRKPPTARMMTRFLPLELIKKTVLEWWRTEILPRTTNDRDDYAIYKQITLAVKTMHAGLSQKAIEEYAALPDAVKNSKSRTEIFRENMSNWMGATNIIICRRFLKTRSG